MFEIQNFKGKNNNYQAKFQDKDEIKCLKLQGYLLTQRQLNSEEQSGKVKNPQTIPDMRKKICRQSITPNPSDRGDIYVPNNQASHLENL